MLVLISRRGLPGLRLSTVAFVPLDLPIGFEVADGCLVGPLLLPVGVGDLTVVMLMSCRGVVAVCVALWRLGCKTSL